MAAPKYSDGNIAIAATDGQPTSASDWLDAQGELRDIIKPRFTPAMFPGFGEYDGVVAGWNMAITDPPHLLHNTNDADRIYIPIPLRDNGTITDVVVRIDGTTGSINAGSILLRKLSNVAAESLVTIPLAAAIDFDLAGVDTRISVALTTEELVEGDHTYYFEVIASEHAGGGAPSCLVYSLGALYALGARTGAASV